VLQLPIRMHPLDILHRCSLTIDHLIESQYVHVPGRRSGTYPQLRRVNEQPDCGVRGRGLTPPHVMPGGGSLNWCFSRIYNFSPVPSALSLSENTPRTTSQVACVADHIKMQHSRSNSTPGHARRPTHSETSQ